MGANPITVSPDRYPTGLAASRGRLYPQSRPHPFTALVAPQKSQLGLDEIPFSPTTFEILLPDRGFYMEPTELFLVGNWTRDWTQKR